MTPEEKAKELIGKFRQEIYRGILTPANVDLVREQARNERAKQCALVAVEEVLAALYNSQLNLQLNSAREAIEWFGKLSSQIEFNKKVKEEINKL